MKFIADVMLGRLARWMRFAGYDVEYDNAASDDALVKRSRFRILLTKDRPLFHRIKNGNAYLVEAIGAPAQFGEIQQRFPLSSSKARCIECNVLLKRIDKKRITHLVPPYVFSRYETFLGCRSCGRIYWSGGHYEQMMRMLK